MKIFVIGKNKTGTRSLHEALLLLGYRSLHDPRGCSRIGKEALAGRRHPLLDQYDAFLDGSLHKAYRPLAEWFPDARFILTTRDKEAWILSRINHVLFNRLQGTSKWREINTIAWSQEWDEHYEEVERFFRGTSRCLTLDVCGGDGWEKLCPFLDEEVPAAAFPTANQTKAKYRRLESCPCCHRPFAEVDAEG